MRSPRRFQFVGLARLSRTTTSSRSFVCWHPLQYETVRSNVGKKKTNVLTQLDGIVHRRRDELVASRVPRTRHLHHIPRFVSHPPCSAIVMRRTGRTMLPLCGLSTTSATLSPFSPLYKTILESDPTLTKWLPLGAYLISCTNLVCSRIVCHVVVHTSSSIKILF